MDRDAILGEVDRFFTDKLRQHGPTPRGVDWNTAEAQELRFAELLRIVDRPGPFSILDYGCGYGPMAAYLGDRPATYVGYDLSAAMVEQARATYGQSPTRRFTADATQLVPADYVVASGIFNMKQATPTADWQAIVEETIDAFDRLAVRGFAFNLLSSHCDRRRPDLFYADPLYWFDRCRQRHARRVALLHDYTPWEFTLLVRKDVG